MELLLDSLEGCASISCLSLVSPTFEPLWNWNISKEEFSSRLIRLCDKLSQLVALFCFLICRMRTAKRLINRSLGSSEQSGQRSLSTFNLCLIRVLIMLLMEKYGTRTIPENSQSCTTTFSLVVKVKLPSFRTIVTHSFGVHTKLLFLYSLCDQSQKYCGQSNITLCEPLKKSKKKKYFRG